MTGRPQCVVHNARPRERTFLLTRRSRNRILSVVQLSYKMVHHMKLITVRDLRVQPGTVWQQLEEEEALVLTSNGRPIAIMLDAKDVDVGELLTAVRRARAQQAVSRMRGIALERGTDRLSGEEIADEIAASRRERGE